MPHASPSRLALVPAWLALGVMGLVTSGPTIISAEAPLAVLEPAKATPAVARTHERQRWSWNQSAADVTPSGDLAWKPAPFAFEAGKTIRYIDYDKGSDDGAGTKEAPWKHHPWDAAAGGQAKASKGGVTYVFKRGVTYRGELHASESGAEGDPIRLTSDPKWGEGEAVIAGSEAVTGWKKGADNPDIPDAGSVWYADVAFAPRCVWSVSGKTAKDRVIERVELARTPNWKVSDPEDIMSEWWQWEQPEWWTNKNHIDFEGHRAHLGVDAKHLDKPASYYVGATVRTEYAIVMGTPFPTRVEGYDANRKGLIFQGIWYGDSEQLTTNCHYYLEDKPQYLDAAGEFWFDRKGEGGRLYLRLPGDRDPNQATVEVGRRTGIIESEGLSHVAITGLSFRFTNTWWDLTLAGWGHKDVDNACVRVLGPADDLRIANCLFDHAARAVRIESEKDGLDRIVISDNDISELDHGALLIKSCSKGDVKVLRNRLHVIGLRSYRQDHSHAVQVLFPATMEVAGNMLDRITGSGLFLYGGKSTGDTKDVALSRQLVHGNRAVDTLLAANDWGGIETWQGGPFYVYDNISGNPNGHWWGYAPDKPGSGRLGFAYYHDGGFKNYDFNNVAWGRSSDAKSRLCNQAAFYEAVWTVENTMFNNTVSQFYVGTQWSPGGGRHLFLGNLFLDVSGMIFQHGKLKEDKDVEVPGQYPHQSMAYSRNVIGGKLPEKLGVFETNGNGYADLATMKTAMAEHHPLAGDIGETSSKPLVKDVDKHDFHPVAGSAAIDHGVKVFVPWGLSRVVGEWQFRRDNADPSVLIDNHWNMAPYYVARENYHAMPRYDLKAEHVKAEDFVAGALEDWTASALTFNGTDQYAHVSTEVLDHPVTYESGGDKDKKKVTATGKELINPDIDTGNLLIEAYFQTKAGQGSCVLVAKMAEAGYQLAINKAGGITFSLKSAGQLAELASGAIINDGKWHHVIAEIDRATGAGSIYVDGKSSATGKLALPDGASLSNAAELLVGKNADGHFFAGAIDFLRIARGTLADAKTSIDELYDWELDGPFLRDFAGHDTAGKSRDAGAFESDGK